MTNPYDPGNVHDPSWPQSGYDPKGHPTSGQPAPAYPPPAYPPAYPGYGYGPPAPTNGLAIAALVCAIAGVGTCVTAPVGAILGHVARRQIRERGEGGDGLALAGIIVGWILTGLFLLLIALWIAGFALVASLDPESLAIMPVAFTAPAFTAPAG